MSRFVIASSCLNELQCFDCRLKIAERERLSNDKNTRKGNQIRKEKSTLQSPSLRFMIIGASFQVNVFSRVSASFHKLLHIVIALCAKFRQNKYFHLNLM